MLVSPTKPPNAKGGAILSPDGLKRFFIAHGGLFRKDEVTRRYSEATSCGQAARARGSHVYV